MEAMFLRQLEEQAGTGPHAELIRMMRAAKAPIPQIFHLFAFKPNATQHLSRYAQEVMRGSSPLSPGMRELIAAFTSKENYCPF